MISFSDREPGDSRSTNERVTKKRNVRYKDHYSLKIHNNMCDYCA